MFAAVVGALLFFVGTARDPEFRPCPSPQKECSDYSSSVVVVDPGRMQTTEATVEGFAKEHYVKVVSAAVYAWRNGYDLHVKDHRFFEPYCPSLSDVIERCRPREVKASFERAPDETPSSRRLASIVVSRVLKLKPRVRATINESLPETKGGSCLGVYVRSDDHAGRRVAFEEYAFLIDHFLTQERQGQVLVGAEDNPAFYTEIRLASHGERRRRIHFFSDMLNENGKLGRNLRAALVFIELLARCDYLLYASSAAAEAAIYRNFALHDRSLNLDHSGNDDDVLVPWVKGRDVVDDSSTTTSSHCRVRGEVFSVKRCADSLESTREQKWRAVKITLNFVSVAEASSSSSEALLEPKARRDTSDVAIAIRENFTRTMERAIDAAVEATSGHVRVDVETMISSPIVAAEVVDAWLTPRLDWGVLNESEYHVVLYRPSGHRQIQRLLRFVQEIQYTSSKVCDRARVAFAGYGFFGMSLSVLSRDFVKNVKWGDERVIPLFEKNWPYFDADYGCSSLKHHLFLHCYFLPSHDCDDFDPSPLLVQKREETESGGVKYTPDIPSKGSDELCGSQQLSLRVLRHGNKRWRYQCDPSGAEDAEFVRLLAASGDQEAWHKHRTGAERSRDRKFFGKESFVGPHQSKALLQLGILLFVAFRPNRRTRAETRSRAESWKKENPGWGGECAAVHVRHGDKLTHVWQRGKKQDRGFVLDLQDYVSVAVENGMSRIMLMTDDRDIVDDIPRIEKEMNVTLFHVNPGRPLVSTRSVAEDESLRQVNHQVQCRKDMRASHVKIVELQEQLRSIKNPRKSRGYARGLLQQLKIAFQEAREAPKSCAHDYSRDPLTGKFVGSGELLQWLTTWELMSRCDLFVGYSITDSFFTELIYAYLCVRRFYRQRECPRLRLLQKNNNQG